MRQTRCAVVPDQFGSGWQVRRDDRTIAVFLCKSDALARAVTLARVAAPSRLIVRDRDGRIEADRTYQCAS